MRNLSLLSVVVALYCAASSSSLGATIFVDKYSPGPTHDGKSWQTAFTTILQGYTSAQANDEVWVGLGTYAEVISIRPNVSLYGGFIGYELFRDQRLGIRGITTLTLATSTTGAILSATGNLITESTVIDGFTFAPDAKGAYTGAAIKCNNASPTISHNAIVGMTLVSTGLISISNAKAVIRNNLITACRGIGEFPAPAISLSAATGAITNNTIVGNSGYAMSGTTSALIANNILAHNIGFFALSAYGKLPTYRNNCLCDNLKIVATQTVGTDPSGSSGNFTADPRLAIPGYGNLHLAADSPCRDAGYDTAVAEGDTDIDYQPRIQGPHVDIGADESDGRTWTFTPRIVRVSSAGNDANDGSTWALAKKSIQAGIDLAASYGGDVWVQSGTYALTTTTGPVVLKPFCYLYGGFNGHETAFDQRDWIANPTVISAVKVNILTAQGGFRASAVDGFLLTGGTIFGRDPAGISCIGASPFIRNNVFLSMTGPAVVAALSRPVITNNAFYNNALGSSQYLVGGTSCELTVVGNVFSANGSGSVSQAMGTVYGDKSSTCLVKDNLFEGNLAGTSAASTATGGVQCGGLIANNTFINNRGIAVNALNATVANNIVAFNDTGIVTVASNPVFSNCVFGNTKNYGQTDRTGKDANLAVYPLFNSLISGDYRLMSTSPCVDAGRDMYVQPGDGDLDGLPRIQGRGVDMGCYESSASSMVARWGDIVRALRIAGGLAPSDPTDIALIRGAHGGTEGIGLTDAESIIIRLTRGL